MPLLRSVLRIAALVALAAPAVLPGQAPPPRCAAIPDTAAAPSARQIAEADEMREQLRAILRAHALPEQGLLMVDVDSTRQGRLLFMEAAIPDASRAAVLAHVAEYLRGIPGGHRYQALVRMDATYPAMLPGKHHCRPVVADFGRFHELSDRVQDTHPAAGRHVDRPLRQRVVVLLVVSRDGHVAYADVVQATGDEHLDVNAAEIVKQIRFEPASLDNVPIDARIRFTVQFTIR